MVTKITYISSLIFLLSTLGAIGQSDQMIVLICPENVTLQCLDDLGPLADYGVAYYVKDEEKIELEDQKSKKQIDDCNRGYVIRSWRYVDLDDVEHNCDQYIYIGEDSVGRALINWPEKEVNLSWCTSSFAPRDLKKNQGFPSYNVDSCYQMEHTYSDEIVYLSGDCKQVKRHWVVHDWCYDVNSVKNKSSSHKYTQIISFTIPEEYHFTVPKDITIKSEDCEKAEIVMDNMTAGFSGCKRRVSITNDSKFATNSIENASGVYPVGITMVNYKVDPECEESKTYTQKIEVISACLDSSIGPASLEKNSWTSFASPNPFNQITEIYVHCPINEQGILTIANSQGDVVYTKKISHNGKDLQAIQISDNDLKALGVYLYSVVIGEKILSGKLIKIR